MAYKPPPQQFSQFKQSLTFEDIVRQQITKCLQFKNDNDEIKYVSAVKGLVGLVTPKMSDETYLTQMNRLQTGWESKSLKIQTKYKRELVAARGGCPDLIQSPSDSPDREYWEDAFGNCLALFERRGLLMKFETIDPLA